MNRGRENNAVDMGLSKRNVADRRRGALLCRRAYNRNPVPKPLHDHFMFVSERLHVGEVRRNPYHLLVPPWMQDNVRRGGELVGGQGGAAPDFFFCTLYRLRRWANGRLDAIYEGGRSLPASEPAASALGPA